MTRGERERLLDAARLAQRNSYAPYSGFRVGAAALTGSGDIVAGCNIENAAYGPTVCAERVALFAARARGLEEVRGIAITSSEGGTCTPCGTCRQVIWELAPEAEIVMEGREGEISVQTISQLLPMPFGPENLGIKRGRG